MFDWHWHDLWTFVRTGFDRFVWYSCTACLSCTLVVWFHYRRYLDPEFDLCHYTIYLWTQVWSNFLLYSAILCELFSKSEKTKQIVFNLPQSCWFSASQPVPWYLILHCCCSSNMYMHIYIFSLLGK